MSEHEHDSEPQAQDAPPAAGSVDSQSIEGLFLAALTKSNPDERRAFLDEACDDDEKRKRVEALLRAYFDAGNFLEEPAAGRPVVPDTLPAEEIRLDFLEPAESPDYLGAIGPYQVLETIGRGGMGIVLRALDPKLNRIVAVKVLAPELAAAVNARRRFVREAQAAAPVSHPHVVTIHAVDEGRLPYLVMECIVGQSLQERLDKAGMLGLTEILRIGRQIADGLQAAHSQGLIHRDIKPANILLENGVQRVKITDFGLARAVDDVTITRTGEVTGTPHYMSPEQARGDYVDQRSDLFSLGCVLYAMCTGRPPFRGDTLASVIKRVLEDTPRPIAEINPEIPQWLIDVIDRLLAKDPDQRYPSAAEVAQALATHLAGVQGAPPRAGVYQPAPQPVGRSPIAGRKWLYTLVIPFVVGVGLGAFRGVSELAAFWMVLGAVLFGWFGIRRCHQEGRQPWLHFSHNDLKISVIVLLLSIALNGNLDLALSAAAACFLASLVIGIFKFVKAQPASATAQSPRPASDSFERRLLRVGLVGVLFLVLVAAVSFVVALVLYLFALVDPVVVTIDWDPAYPVVELESPLGNTPVESRPNELSLRPGRHQVTVVYEDAGKRYRITRPVTVNSAGPRRVDFGAEIARDRAMRASVGGDQGGAPLDVKKSPAEAPDAEPPGPDNSPKPSKPAALQSPSVSKIPANSPVGTVGPGTAKLAPNPNRSE